MLEFLKKSSLAFLGFWQALGLILYCALVGTLMWNGEEWFGKLNHLLGPIFVLLLLVVSALVCALIALGYPFWLFWERKQGVKALKLVIFTTVWLTFFVFLIILLFLTA